MKELLDYLGLATVLALTFKEAVWDTGGNIWRAKGRTGWKTWTWFLFLIVGVVAMANSWWQTRQDSTTAEAYRKEAHDERATMAKEMTVVRHDLEQSRDRERAAEEKRSQALTLLGESNARIEDLQQSAASLTSQLGRIVEAVETQFGVEGYEAALDALENRLGEVERRSVPRRLSQEAASKILQSLHAGPARSLHVQCNGSDVEGCSFADDLFQVFQTAGWNVVIGQGSGAQTLRGFLIGNTGESLSPGCIEVLNALSAVGHRPKPVRLTRDFQTLGGKKECTLVVGMRAEDE